MTTSKAVIVGASHAGAQVAASLRQERWPGEIILIGNESALPYQRPPLSKEYLAGKSTLEALAIRNREFYDKHGIQLVDGTVSAIDRGQGRAVLESGESLTYDKLALCVGARPKMLTVPGADLRGVFYLRTAADVELIRQAAAAASRVIVIGGGYIGLETAASLRGFGLEVAVVEAADRVLERVTDPCVSAFFERLHREEGVAIQTSSHVQALRESSRGLEVVLRDSSSIAADLVVVGIGVEPNVALAADAGLAIDNGILIDANARTTDPNIFAAGDCASHDSARYGQRLRLEAVSSAGEQAKVAAAAMCGKSREIDALPWFWSDQYNVKLQIAGLNHGYDEVVVIGDPARDREFSCFYLLQGELVAADCVNRPRDFIFSKRAISQGARITREELMALTV